MKVIGLTGGIGSGKSTVAAMFEALGVPVYYADIEAKKLMNSSDAIKEGMINLFGKKAYTDKGLNSVFIAEIVFKDKEKLQALNALVHPEVRTHFLQWVSDQKAPYVIQENPLIFEKKQQSYFDSIITVTAKETLRIQRVMDRDNLSRDQVLDRIKNQLDDDDKINHSDFVIFNKTLENTKAQTEWIHQQILRDIP